MDTTKIIHYPRLDSVLMVEKAIYENSGVFNKKQLWESLPKKMMYQTFSAIMGYLLYSKKILIDNRGRIIWSSGMQLEYFNKKVNKNMSKELENISKKIVDLLKEKGVARAGIFGSYARGEQKKGSDVDILIEPPKGMGFEFFGLQDELRKKLKKKVDLLSYNGVSPYMKKRILNEEVRII